MSALLQDRLAMPKDKRDDVPVKLDRKVKRLCEVAAMLRGIPLAQYLSDHMKPIAEADLAARGLPDFDPDAAPQGATEAKRPRRRREG